jgi:hypothetical protein
MSLADGDSAESGTPMYLGGGDPDRTIADFTFHETAARDYYPVWLNNLADDVTLEGSLMNGAVRGPDSVHEIIKFIRTLYENQRLDFAGPYGDDCFLEDYTVKVCGEPTGSLVNVTRNKAGQAQHVAAAYRPRKSLLLLAQRAREHFAGSPLSEHCAIDPEEP